jgi:hypothetical protein
MSMARKLRKTQNKSDFKYYDLSGLMINENMMKTTNKVVRKTNTDMQSVLRAMNIKATKPFFSSFVLLGMVDKIEDIQFENINYMRELTKTLLITLQENFRPENLSGIWNLKGMFNISEDFDVEINESLLTKYIGFLDNEEIDTHYELLEKINMMLIDLEYLILYLHNAYQDNKELDFEEELEEYRKFLDVLIKGFDYNDFNLETSFYGAIYNIFALHRYFIDDFEIYILKKEVDITKDNIKTICKDFKLVASKSEKIKERRKIQKEHNLNLSDYFRAAVFNVLNIEVKN